jgi:hypothetical protein
MLGFVPTDDERALVKLLAANGYAQHLNCQYISAARKRSVPPFDHRRGFVTCSFLSCHFLHQFRGTRGFAGKSWPGIRPKPRR